jgi:steroid delta-isomerase-like uncharacterized protein
MGQTADIARRWFTEVWRDGGEQTIDELLSPGIVGFMEGRDIRSVAEFKEARTQLMNAFPDLRIEVEDIIEQGDKAAVRWHVTATHAGDGLGFAATQRPVVARGITWQEIRNGQVVRAWDSWNMGALMMQLTAPDPQA